MSLKKSVIVVIAALFAVVLNLYLFVHQWLRELTGTTVASANECTDVSAHAPATNPNKMLFISCGGFLD